MTRRRLAICAAVVALAAALVCWWRRTERGTEPGTPPDTAPAPRPASVPAWVPPVDGGCPDGYPVKVARSGIFHVPGGRSYDRTVPDRCYASADAAEADGYRRAKA